MRGLPTENERSRTDDNVPAKNKQRKEQIEEHQPRGNVLLEEREKAQKGGIVSLSLRGGIFFLLFRFFLALRPERSGNIIGVCA